MGAIGFPRVLHGLKHSLGVSPARSIGREKAAQNVSSGTLLWTERFC